MEIVQLPGSTEWVMDEAKAQEFRRELAALLNRYSIESHSNTPDYILSNYLCECLDAFANTSRAREKWYGKSLTIGDL